MIITAVTTLAAVACSTAVSPTAGAVALYSYVTGASAIKSFMISLSVIVVVGVYVIEKYKIKLPFFNNTQSADMKMTIENLEKQLKHLTEETQTQFDSLIAENTKISTDFTKLVVNIPAYGVLKSKTLREIGDIRTIYAIDIERDTDMYITKILEIIDQWFSASDLDKSTHPDPKCNACRKTSFASSLENIATDLKDEFHIAFENHHIFNVEPGAEFDSYVNTMFSTFRKIIRSSLNRFYIMPDEIDSFFSASPQNLQFENTMTKVYDVIHTLISQTRVKEKKMFDKIAELKTDMEKETKILFPNLTMDGL